MAVISPSDDFAAEADEGSHQDAEGTVKGRVCGSTRKKR